MEIVSFPKGVISRPEGPSVSLELIREDKGRGEPLSDDSDGKEQPLHGPHEI